MIIRNLEAIFSFKYNPHQLKKATSELDKFAKKANGLINILAGHYVLNGLKNIMVKTAEAMDRVNKVSGNFGITVEALQELSYAAEKSGISIDRFEDSFKEFMIRATDARAGLGESAQGFSMLGIKTADALGRMREPLELLDEVADKISKLPTQSDKIWVTDKIFGDSGYVMLNMLGKGSRGIAELREQARALGLVLNHDATKRATEFNNALKAMRASSGGLSRSLTQDMMPATTTIMEKIGKITAKLNEINSQASLLRPILLGLGIGVLGLGWVFRGAIIAAAPMLGLITAMIAACGALGLVLSDLWVAFEGGESITGKFFKKAVSWKEEYNKSNQVKQYQMLEGLMPDFLLKFKNEGLKSFKLDQQEAYNKKPTQKNYAPSMSSLGPINRNTANQSVNVAVNVKSGANPHEIGAEVSKAVRKELEKERFSAFIGVSQYAV